MNKYVAQLLEVNGESIHCEEVAIRKEKPVATNKRNSSRHHYLHPRRLLRRSINGNGMKFSPLNTLMRDPYPSVSRSQ